MGETQRRFYILPKQPPLFGWMQGATKPIAKILGGQELHIHRMKQRQPLMRPPARTKSTPTGDACLTLMRWISIELLKPLTTPVHG
jgi:hypothetical protein